MDLADIIKSKYSQHNQSSIDALQSQHDMKKKHIKFKLSKNREELRSNKLSIATRIGPSRKDISGERRKYTQKLGFIKDPIHIG